jgi:hypothetical protein
LKERSAKEGKPANVADFVSKVGKEGAVMANADFVVTITTTGANQTEANTRRDNAVLDYAKMRNLPIFEADGVTLKSNAAIATLVRTDIKDRLKVEVVRYREFIASNLAASGVKAAVDAEIP